MARMDSEIGCQPSLHKAMASKEARNFALSARRDGKRFQPSQPLRRSRLGVPALPVALCGGGRRFGAAFGVTDARQRWNALSLGTP
jgi:hypothetical protein